MLRTIRAKLLIGFFLIFLLFFFILNQMVARNLESGNHRIITDNLIALKNNSTAYVRQSFLIRHFANDELYFGQIAEEMSQDLQQDTSTRIGMYSVDGDLLYADDPTLFTNEGDDLLQAVQGKTAYTITEADGTASVLFAYPVVVEGTKVGIIRFAKDFSLLYEQSNQIQRTIFTIATVVFMAAFLFTYLLSRHITVPLVKLSRASAEVMNGKLDTRLTLRRSDEIGQLSDNLNRMMERIRDQIARIERDRDQLEELNHVRKRFFDNVTHELKTPLTTIMGYADLIHENEARDPELFDKGMTHIKEESRRLYEMVLELLSLSKESYGAETRSEVDVGSLLQDVCETMAMKAERYKKAIKCDTEEGLRVFGQPDKLRRLFINLLDNAIKYGDAHTDIEVTARRDTDRIRLVFANEGPSIDPEELKRIVEPFYRTDPHQHEADSAGLGLSISQAIVEEHQGSLRITSDGELIRVYIDLPSEETEGRGMSDA